MKALSIVLVVMVIALTGFSAWQFTELAELKSRLVDVFEIDKVQATSTRELVHASMLMAVHMADWGLAISEYDWAKIEEAKEAYEDATETRDLMWEYLELLSESKLALLKGDAD